MRYQQYTRRNMLKQTASLSTLAAASILSPTILKAEEKKTPPADSPKRNLKFALKYGMIGEKLSVVDKFKLVKDLGYDAIEIYAEGKFDKKDVAKAIQTTGLPVHGLHRTSNMDLKDAIDIAKYYNASSILIVAGKVDEKNPYDVVYKQQQARIRKVIPYAEKQNIKLLVENVWNNFLLSPLEMARFLDEMQSPIVGCYFDIGNVVRFGYPDQWIRILGKRLGKLDVKEYSRKKQREEGLRKGFQVEIGEGDAGWQQVREALKDINYNTGWATAEVKGGDRKRLAEILTRMQKVLGPDA